MKRTFSTSTLVASSFLALLMVGCAGTDDDVDELDDPSPSTEPAVTIIDPGAAPSALKIKPAKAPKFKTGCDLCGVNK